MGFVKFAVEEKRLFRRLYPEGEQPEAYQSHALMQKAIGVIVDAFGYEEDAARRFHQAEFPVLYCLRAALQKIFKQVLTSDRSVTIL